MNYQQALSSLPTGRTWSSSFGNAGEGGYAEYWRTADGRRFEVRNGTYEASAPFIWTAKEVAA